MERVMLQSYISGRNNFHTLHLIPNQKAATTAINSDSGTDRCSTERPLGIKLTLAGSEATPLHKDRAIDFDSGQLEDSLVRG